MVVVVGVKDLRSTFSARDHPDTEINGGGGVGAAGTALSWAPRATSKLFFCACVCVCDLQAAQSGGHKTLLYGHAILLRHSFSSMVRLTAVSVAISRSNLMGGH